MDVYPENSTVFTVTGLALGTSYAFSVLAYNDKGESGFTDTDVKATTLSEFVCSVEVHVLCNVQEYMLICALY